MFSLFLLFIVDFVHSKVVNCNRPFVNIPFVVIFVSDDIVEGVKVRGVPTPYRTKESIELL